MANGYITAKFYLSPREALGFLALGDSKTNGDSWPGLLDASLETETTPQPWTYVLSANDGIGLEDFVSTIDTRLDTYNYLQDCPHILVNLGINNILGVGGAVFDEATNKASMQTIIDGCVARWPTCKVYLTKVWGRDYDTDCNTFAGWVDDLVALNANAYVGMDERVTVKGDDNGATNTLADGIHYSDPAGEIAVAAAWKALLGY